MLSASWRVHFQRLERLAPFCEYQFEGSSSAQSAVSTHAGPAWLSKNPAEFLDCQRFDKTYFPPCCYLCKVFMCLSLAEYMSHILHTRKTQNFIR